MTTGVMSVKELREQILLRAQSLIALANEPDDLELVGNVDFLQQDCEAIQVYVNGLSLHGE